MGNNAYELLKEIFPGIEAYKALIVPKLQLIQQMWLEYPQISPSIMSLGLQSTNKALVESAASTNKTVDLGKSREPRASHFSKKVKKSQAALLKQHRELRKY